MSLSPSASLPLTKRGVPVRVIVMRFVVHFRLS